MNKHQLTGLQKQLLRQILVDNLRGIESRPSFDIGKIDYIISSDTLSYRLDAIIDRFLEVLLDEIKLNKAAPLMLDALEMVAEWNGDPGKYLNIDEVRAAIRAAKGE